MRRNNDNYNSHYHGLKNRQTSSLRNCSTVMAHLHCATPIPRPIPVPRQSELGLMIMFGSVSTGPRL